MKRTEIINGQITCKKCNEAKDLIYFCRRPENNSYRGTCKMCSKGYKDSLFKKQQENILMFSQGVKQCGCCKKIKDLSCFHSDRYTRFGYASNCRECISEKVKLTQRQNSLKSNYNLTLDDYNNMLKDQNHSCAICLSSLSSDEVKTPHVDHCHVSGKVRGILCRYCNHGLGLFKDNIISLQNAITYLKIHNHDN